MAKNARSRHVIQHGGYRQVPAGQIRDHAKDFSRTLRKLQGALYKRDAERICSFEDRIDRIVERWERDK
jgi:hypothetical protein